MGLLVGREGWVGWVGGWVGWVDEWMTDGWIGGCWVGRREELGMHVWS
jgi:hypothetical protein